MQTNPNSTRASDDIKPHKPLVHLTQIGESNNFYISVAVKLNAREDIDYGSWEKGTAGEFHLDLTLSHSSDPAHEDPRVKVFETDQFVRSSRYNSFTVRIKEFPSGVVEHKCALLYKYAEKEDEGQGDPSNDGQ